MQCYWLLRWRKGPQVKGCRQLLEAEVNGTDSPLSLQVGTALPWPSETPVLLQTCTTVKIVKLCCLKALHDGSNRKPIQEATISSQLMHFLLEVYFANNKTKFSKKKKKNQPQPICFNRSVASFSCCSKCLPCARGCDSGADGSHFYL